jgi:hypothetical protein
MHNGLDVVEEEEIRSFLAANNLNPRERQYVCAEAVASHFGLPIYAAQALVRSL